MNKKKFSYILFIVFLFNFFNVEVKAAKVLSCAYYNSEYDYAIKLAQSSTKFEYKNLNTTSIGGVYMAKKSDVIKDGKALIEASWGNPVMPLEDVYLYSADEQTLDKPSPNSNYIKNLNKPNLSECPQAIVVQTKRLNKNKISVLYAFASTEISVFKSYKTGKNLYVMHLSNNSDTYVDTTVNEVTTTIEKDNKVKCSSIEDKWINKDSTSYASCLYYHDLSKDRGCMILQIDIEKSGAVTPLAKFPKLNNVGKNNIHGTLGKNFGGSFIKNEREGKCPRKVYISYDAYKEHEQIQSMNNRFDYTIDFTINDKKSEWDVMTFEDSKGKNIVSGEKMDVYDKYSGYNLIFKFDWELSCDDLMGEDGELAEMLNMLVKLIKIAIPIILIGLGSVDFVKATFSGEESNMKKAQTKFIKRLIIGVAIFLVPSLLHLILEIASNIWTVIDADLCGIL